MNQRTIPSSLRVLLRVIALTTTFIIPFLVGGLVSRSLTGRPTRHNAETLRRNYQSLFPHSIERVVRITRFMNQRASSSPGRITTNLNELHELLAPSSFTHFSTEHIAVGEESLVYTQVGVARE